MLVKRDKYVPIAKDTLDRLRASKHVGSTKAGSSGVGLPKSVCDAKNQ